MQLTANRGQEFMADVKKINNELQSQSKLNSDFKANNILNLWYMAL
jgi:hypothetical protein